MFAVLVTAVIALEEIELISIPKLGITYTSIKLIIIYVIDSEPLIVVLRNTVGYIRISY
jgi:hypothetical protein